MKKILLGLALLGSIYASAQDCIKNSALMEPMLVPTQQDSFNHDVMAQNHKDMPAMGYLSLVYTRGIVDTGLLFGSKVAPMSVSLRNALVASPLIVEGVITQMTEADTTASAKNKYYSRSYTVQIKNVVKSKYKIAAGDKVIVKSNISGYHKNNTTNKVTFTASRMFDFYEKGKTYLFVLDKYEYMQNLYLIKNRDARYRNYFDEYCPTAFSFLPATIGISKEYAEKVFTIEELKKYLSKNN